MCLFNVAYELVNWNFKFAKFVIEKMVEESELIEIGD